MEVNNSVCQEYPTFCFSIIQVSLFTLAFCVYCHWAVPSLVCDWAFTESGCIFRYWEPGLIPLNKICYRKTFRNKIKPKLNSKKQQQQKSLLIYILNIWNFTKPWIYLYFVLFCYVHVKDLQWLEFITITFLLSEKQMYISVILHVCCWYSFYFLLWFFIVYYN